MKRIRGAAWFPAWIALCVCAALAGASPGGAQSMYDPERSKRLDKAIEDHVTLTRGSRWWPDDPFARSQSGLTADEINRRQVERMRTGDVIAAAVEVRGPRGLVQPFTFAFGESITASGRSFEPDGELKLKPKEVDGLFIFAVGLAVGDKAWAASRTDVLPGQAVAVPLGDGYSVNITMERRAPTPGEQRTNNMIADSMEKTFAEGFPPQPAPKDDSLPPPVDYSPFTNSVIRQGAPAK